MKRFLLKSALKWFLAILLSLIAILLAFSAGAFLYQKKYQGKIYPGVKIGGMELSGKTLQEAEKEIQQMTDNITKNEIIFTYENETVPVSPTIFSTVDPSLIREILTFNIKGMAKAAYASGRNGGTIGENFLSQIDIFLHNENILPIYTLNEAELINILQANFSLKERPAKNALLKIGDEYNMEIEKEEYGYKINYENAIKKLISHLDAFTDNEIKISLINSNSEPKIKKDEMIPAMYEASDLLRLAPFKLKYNENEWLLDKKMIKDWIILKNNFSTNLLSDGNKNFHYITFDSAKAIKYLEETIAPKINIIPQNAKFEIKDGKVIEFQESRDGVELDIEKNYEYICSKVFEDAPDAPDTDLQAAVARSIEIELIVKTIRSDVTMENINDMGIKEIIGIGKSNFKGSPKNRRHNIKTGAKALNGVLSNPEEEFSLVAALGEINGESGYLPELVIKGNKTIPEYGGGLCQIGTTLFRTALESGLPITERQNHSYRVSYYEPAGTDATIYNPRPDMKFLNDTGKYILIQTKIEGDELIFEFWGSKDGRTVEKTDPKIYNIVKPGPTKIIETEDLAPGQKKCTETSHNGADAEFNYKITYPDGTLKDETFKSHYKPWQAVCLIGKETTLQDTASSTEEVIQ